MQVCKKCKWGVVGKFSRVYGGCPIGCKKPEISKKDKCFEAKNQETKTYN